MWKNVMEERSCTYPMNDKEKATKKGRPPKKDYDGDKLLEQLLDCVVQCYEATGEIKATAAELDLHPVKVKKLLITAGKLQYDETRQIQRLLAYGKKIVEIEAELGLKKAAINSYLPYSKVPYKESEKSANADRCDLYRKRKSALENLSDTEHLWECLVLFQDYPFSTEDGIVFKYTIPKDDEGQPARQLVIQKGKDKQEEMITFAEVVEEYERVKAGGACGENKLLRGILGKMVAPPFTDDIFVKLW